MPARAPVYKAAPALMSVYNWTGFYVGGNVGYSWGRADSEVTVPDFVPGIGAFAAVLVIPGGTFSDRVNPDGIIGGGQIGWNSQVGNWVFGLEADFQASGQKNTSSRSDPFDFFLCDPQSCILARDDVEGTSATTLEAKLRWFGTARVRLGYAWDGLLWYGTGGLAYGEFRLSGTSVVSGTIVETGVGLGSTLPFSATTTFNVSKRKAGWTLGAGLEGSAWASNWTWKVEYLYIDFGTFDHSFETSAGTITTSTDLTDHILRVGLNYRFGAPGKGPLVARY